MIDKQVMELKKLWANKRQLTFQLLNLAMIVFSALMIWKGLMFVTKVRVVFVRCFVVVGECGRGFSAASFIGRHSSRVEQVAGCAQCPSDYG